MFLFCLILSYRFTKYLDRAELTLWSKIVSIDSPLKGSPRPEKTSLFNSIKLLNLSPKSLRSFIFAEAGGKCLPKFCAENLHSDLAQFIKEKH